MKLALHILAALNLFDAIITAVGIKNDLIKEANPLMDSLYSTHPILFVSVKIILSMFIYALIIYDKVPAKKWFAPIAYTAIALYSFTFVLHGFWIYHLVLN
ncbi:hypothetical protein FZC78_08420 [Rossellomorea vietnamensis]|uniref:DUF5658 domain-containing protein n=1 Tax=Rossellomorea vietnamensis TaxID=218284 RepID=A0A5D4NV96_9BACI|nr:DUF5658 family protein [Rossellomorea vietnamensis]TYS17860.1 hypothetical protein FZC78_08420 [Rossellomorea vietnamensis]